jgi:hypothetical protein
MPRSKRPPIAYKPQFAGEIFRPKDVVESELDDVPPEPTARDTPQPERSSAQENERSTGRTNVRTYERTGERVRIRHSFDIYQDQLIALADIQIAAFRLTGRKPPIGELVQEALDEYIQSAAEQSDERSSERTTGRRR